MGYKMKLLLQIFAIAICTVTVSAVIRRFNAEMTIPVLIVGCTVLIFLSLEPLGEAVSTVVGLADAAGFGEYFGTILKALGCAFTAQTAADICRDAGENSLASKVELAGRAELLLIAAPLAAEIVETACLLSGV